MVRVGTVVLSQPPLGLGEPVDATGVEKGHREAGVLQRADDVTFVATAGLQADAIPFVLVQPVNQPGKIRYVVAELKRGGVLRPHGDVEVGASYVLFHLHIPSFQSGLAGRSTV